MNKKRVLFFITLITLLFSIFSCSGNNEPVITNRDYDKKEVEAAAKTLIENSLILNEILYGKGLSWEEDEGNGIYKKAAEDSLDYFGIKTVAELKQKISLVFSSKYIESLNNSDVFAAVKDGENIKFYTRYYDKTEKDGENEKTYILVNTIYDYVLKNKYEYVGNISAVRSEGDFVIVKATVRATRADGKIRDFDHEIKLIEEEAGWRIASSTFVVYTEATDIYEDMNK